MLLRLFFSTGLKQTRCKLIFRTLTLAAHSYTPGVHQHEVRTHFSSHGYSDYMNEYTQPHMVLGVPKGIAPLPRKCFQELLFIRP